jgi:hypothetical protein
MKPGQFHFDRHTMEKTGLEQTVSTHFVSNVEPRRHAPGLAHDPRWHLAQRIVDSPQFCKSPRLSQFLLYIVAKTLEGRQSEVTEQQIGVHVFGRPHGYRTVDDNIVRSYARQLRKRLTEYFASDGVDDEIRIEIPLGSYLPAFTAPAFQKPLPVEAAHDHPGLADLTRPAVASKWGWPRLLSLFVYSVGLIWLTCVVQSRIAAARYSTEPAQLLWKAMLQGPGDTFIVPPDAGLNLIEDMSHRPLPLADYLKAEYLDRPLPGVDAHGESDLRSQQLTDFISLQMVATLAHLTEFNPGHVLLRSPRDLRFDDLKRANALIIGSSCSNPWAVIADGTTNFRIQCNPGMQGATVVNRQPQAGEAASYSSHWNEPIHETYSVIIFAPNLSGYGRLLLLGGLDSAGTQAAGEALMQSGTITPILERARRPDGSLAPFEVLLRSTSIQANATGTQVIASRIH